MLIESVHLGGLTQLMAVLQPLLDEVMGNRREGFSYE